MNFRILILLITALSISACNKWLDVELADTVTEDKLFSTPQGYSEALAGVYSLMASSELYGKKLTMENLDILAQYYSYDAVSSTYERFKNYDYEDAGSQARILSTWTNLYKAISGANNIIRFASKDKSVLDPQRRSQVLGEALALRAYLHFDLIRLFCPDVKQSPDAKGIPYNLEFGVALPPVYTVEENVQLVVDDLREAERLLENDPIGDVVPYTLAGRDAADQYVARINLYGVKALLARVSLARGDKAGAINYAKQVVESGKFRLLDFASTDKPDTEIDMLFSDEHIFALRNKNLSDYSISLHYPEILPTSSRSAYLPFANITTLYEGNNDDVRNIKWFSIVNGNFAKFNVDNKVFFHPKMPLIKLSELYLILAESHLGKDDMLAKSYINELRDHRIRNNSHWSYLTQEYLVQEIKREFVGEGQLWYTYKRLGLGVPTSSGIIGTVPASDRIFVFPMPLKEIETGNRN